MKIQVEFDSYDEMLSFCKSIAGDGVSCDKTMHAAVPIPGKAAAEEPKEPETEPEQEPEQEEEVEVEELPFAETKPAKEKPPVKKEDVRKILAAKKREGKDVSSVIRSFGVEMFKDVPEQSYAELLEKVEAL